MPNLDAIITDDPQPLRGGGCAFFVRSTDLHVQYHIICKGFSPDCGLGDHVSVSYTATIPAQTGAILYAESVTKCPNHNAYPSDGSISPPATSPSS